MFFSALSAALLAAPLVSATGYVHHVVVGGPGILAYDPPYITANVGDVVRFEFRQKNHTATQSSFTSPCSKLQDQYGNFIGFDSGFMPVPDNQMDHFPTYDVHVQSHDPIWVYCQQGTHCSEAGMVFSVNAPPAPAPNSFESFQAIAKGEATPPKAFVPHHGPKEHRVIVGGPGLLLYDPENIQAAVGDTITFEFRQKNHTVTQSSFENPCRKLEFTTNPPQYGFDSGFMPVADDATHFPTYSIIVEDDKPIWAYCRQTVGNHCGSGMVFAANAVETSDKSFGAFKQLAKKINGTASS